MKIDFDAMEPEEIPHYLGGDGVFQVRQRIDEWGKILRGTLDPGSSIGMHTHSLNSETIYILSGSGQVLYDDTCEPLRPGDCHFCPKGHSHSLMNTGSETMEFFAVVAVQ